MKRFLISITVTVAIMFMAIMPKGDIGFFGVTNAFGFFNDDKEVYQKGIGLFIQRNFAGALPFFQKASQLNPNNISAIDYMGVCYLNLKRYDEAIYTFQKVIQLKPDYVSAYNGLGLALGYKGNYAEAITADKKYLSLARNVPEEQNNIPKVEKMVKSFEIELARRGPIDPKTKPIIANDKVEIYVTSRCPMSRRAIMFLKSKGIPFVVYDVGNDPDAIRRERHLTNETRVPFAVIYGQKVQGFSEEKYQAALNSKKAGSR